MSFLSVFFFQAEDGIRDLVRSRGLGDVYKRQLDDSWITYPQDKFVLKAGEEFTSQIKVKSSCSTKPDDYPFSMTLSNTCLL